jgi:hypothetical protein
MESSVLFKSSDNTVVVIDIPRTLEEAQVLPGQTISRRIVSSRPVGEPWQVPEPKKDIAKYVAPSAAVAELMTLGSVKAALKTARADHDGPWYLPRVTHKQAKELDPPVTGGVDADENGNGTANANANATQSQKRKYTPSSLSPEEDSKDGTSRSPFIPEQSYHLPGTIESQREVFLQNAPQFDLIILDPPWPSRSVKRKSDRCMCFKK